MYKGGSIIITLRPHHLLCTQSYMGKGYNNEFVKNMDTIVSELRSNKSSKILIKFTTDDVCKACPNRLRDNLCESNEKVIEIDKKVVEYFNLKEGIYNYNYLVLKIKNEITEKVFDYICCKCCWYEYNICKPIILKGIG